MMEHENAFYMAHQAEFQEKYLNKWLVITGESLWGVFDTVPDAAKNALQHFKPGEFMIHTPAHDGMVIEVGPNIHVRYPDDMAKPRPTLTLTTSGGELVSFPYA